MADFLPKPVDIFIVRRTSRTFDVHITDELTGADVNLSGATVELLAQDTLGGAITMQITNTDPHSGFATGRTTMTIAVADTDAASPVKKTRWPYVVQYFDGAAEAQMAMVGDLVVSPTPQRTPFP